MRTILKHVIILQQNDYKLVSKTKYAGEIDEKYAKNENK